MKRILKIALLLVAFTHQLWAHQLTVHLQTPYRGKVTLVGHQGFQNKTLAKENLNGIRSITLHIPDDYQGVANLEFEGYNGLFLLLNREDIELEIGQLQEMKPISFLKGNENIWLNTYVNEQRERVAKRNGLRYLLPLYQADKNDSLYDLMQKEFVSLDAEEAAFFNNLPDNSYIKYYIPLRQFVEDQVNAARNKQENSAPLLAQFYQFNLADDRFWNSGLIGSFIEGHVALCEQQSGIEQIHAPCQKMVDHIYMALKGQPFKLLDLAEFLLRTFEKRGLEQAAEYLSLTLLNQNKIAVEGDLRNKMEQYRAMAIGNTAADIAFNPPVKGQAKLSDMASYKLLFFWKSGCAGCKEATPDLVALQNTLKDHNIDIIGFSLDTDNGKFQNYARQMPWPSRSDLKGWESQTAKDYHLFGTPAFYLLDAENKILFKPKSMAQLEMYVKNGLPKE